MTHPKLVELVVGEVMTAAHLTVLVLLKSRPIEVTAEFPRLTVMQT